MILQALKEYYDRVKDELAPEGFETKGLEFLIVIDKDGNFKDIEDTRELDGKKLVAKSFILPRSVKRQGSNSYQTNFLLWDHVGYVLKVPIPKPDKSDNDIKVLAEKQFNSWRRSFDKYPNELKNDDGVKAVVEFSRKEDEHKKTVDRAIEKGYITGKAKAYNVSFRLDTDMTTIIPCRDAVKNFVMSNPNKTIIVADGVDEIVEINDGIEEVADDILEDNEGVVGTCMITGESGIIARTHDSTPIPGANSFISFQKNSGYDSYGKEQGYNAPIIKSTEFAYITALKDLLKSKTQQMLIAGTKAVFWSDKKTQFEDDFSCFFSEIKDNPAENVRALTTLFESPKTGAYCNDDSNAKFFLLGLAQGGGKRICVRFWKTGTIAEFASNIRQHFTDLEITKHSSEPQYYSLWRLLVNSAILDKSENIPPNIAGDFMQAIINGTPYPATILQLVLRRIKSDGGNVKPVRAALIKSYLNRYYRRKPLEKELTVALDKERPSNGYQLGRLFAVLEKIQEEANSGATIRERYYGSACSSPVTVFPTLMRLSGHHSAKLEKGRKIYFDKLTGEIVGYVNNFPAHLDLHKQGEFAIGYYHQRQDFFTPKTKEADNG